MALAARQAMGKKRFKAFADRGYFSGTELKACEDNGITTFVPKPMTSNAKAEGRFGKNDFIYQAKNDTYQCPAGQQAIYRFSTKYRAASIRVFSHSLGPKPTYRAMPTSIGVGPTLLFDDVGADPANAQGRYRPRPLVPRIPLSKGDS